MAAQLGRRRASVSVAPETTFGSVDSATGLVGASGLSYVVAEVFRSTVNFDGQEEPAFDRDLARSYPGTYPPEVETGYASGAAVQRRTADTISIEMPWRGPGSTAMSSTAIGLMLNTVFGSITRAAAITDTINDVTPSTTEFDVSTIATASVGSLLAFEIAGRVEFTCITSTNAGAGPVTVSPALSAAPDNGSTFRYCQTYFPQFGPLTFGTNPSVAIRVCTADRGFYAVGCRLTKIAWSLSGPGNRTVTAKIDLKPAVVVDDTSPSLSNPTITTGGISKFLDCYAVYSSATNIGTTTPAALARGAFAARGWSGEIDVTLDPVGGGEQSVLGVGEWSVADMVARLNVSCDTPTSAHGFESQRLNGYQRSVLVGNSPVAAGCGFGYYLPGAILTSYVKPVVSDTNTILDLSFQDGPWSLDSGNFSNGQAADTSFRFGFCS